MNKLFSLRNFLVCAVSCLVLAIGFLTMGAGTAQAQSICANATASVLSATPGSGGCGAGLYCEWDSGRTGYEFYECPSPFTGSQTTETRNRCIQACTNSYGPATCTPGSVRCTAGGRGYLCGASGTWSTSEVQMHACGYVGSTSCSGAARRFIGCNSTRCGGGYQNCYETCSNGQGTCQAQCVCEPNTSCGQSHSGDTYTGGPIVGGPMPNCSTGGTPPGQPVPTPPVNPPASVVPSTPPAPVYCAKLEVLDPTSLQVLNRQPVAGEEVRFRCLGYQFQPNYYFFTYTDSPTNPLKVIYQGESNVTFPIKLTEYTQVQCNPCQGSNCSVAASVNDNCTFKVEKLAGPQCIKVSVVDATTGAQVTSAKSGQNIQIVCDRAVGATGYTFKVETGTGGSSVLQPVAAGSTRSQVYQIPDEPGTFYAECQICTGAGGSSCYPFSNQRVTK
jgi:hypothetical protein